jgi:hypothetical protein
MTRRVVDLDFSAIFRSGTCLLKPSLPVKWSISESAPKGKAGGVPNFRLCVSSSDKYCRVIALIVGKQQWEQHMEQVQTMQSCNLSHSDVFSCGDSAWLQQRLVNLSELILSNALITSWCTVAAIFRALPTLETLDVSHNLLQLTDTDRDESRPPLSNSLAQLILNSTVRFH